MTERTVRPFGVKPDDRFGTRRLTDARSASQVGEFVFAGSMKVIVFRTQEGKLYYVSRTVEHTIMLRDDGKVTIGTSAPMETVPSLRDALARM